MSYICEQNPNGCKACHRDDVGRPTCIDALDFERISVDEAEALAGYPVEEIPIHTIDPQPLPGPGDPTYDRLARYGKPLSKRRPEFESPIYTHRPVHIHMDNGAMVVDAGDIEFSRIHEIVDRLVCRPEALAKAYNWVLDGIEDEERDAAGSALAGFLLALLNELEQQGIEVRI
jgi:hypothetical protein